MGNCLNKSTKKNSRRSLPRSSLTTDRSPPPPPPPEEETVKEVLSETPISIISVVSDPVEEKTHGGSTNGGAKKAQKDEPDSKNGEEEEEAMTKEAAVLGSCEKIASLWEERRLTPPVGRRAATPSPEKRTRAAVRRRSASPAGAGRRLVGEGWPERRVMAVEKERCREEEEGVGKETLENPLVSLECFIFL